MLFDRLCKTFEVMLSNIKRSQALAAALNVHLGPTQRIRLPNNLDGQVRLHGDPELDMSLSLDLKECDTLIAGLLAVAGDLSSKRIATTDGEFLLARSEDILTVNYQERGLIPRYCKSFTVADVIKATTEYRLKREDYDANGAYRLNNTVGSVDRYLGEK